MKRMPSNLSGRWSVGLTLFSVLLLLVFFTFMAIGLVHFSDEIWWGKTVALTALAEIIAFILSIVSIRKKEGRSVFVLVSFALGLCAVLFIFLHSLFIHD